jgi:hypothetical protein
MSDELTPEEELIDCFDELFFEGTATEQHLRKCVAAYTRWRSEISKKACDLLREYLADERIRNGE